MSAPPKLDAPLPTPSADWADSTKHALGGGGNNQIEGEESGYGSGTTRHTSGYSPNNLPPAPRTPITIHPQSTSTVTTPGGVFPGAYPSEAGEQVDPLPNTQQISGYMEAAKGYLPDQETVKGYVPDQTTIGKVSETVKGYLPGGVAAYLPGSPTSGVNDEHPITTTTNTTGTVPPSSVSEPTTTANTTNTAASYIPSTEQVKSYVPSTETAQSYIPSTEQVKAYLPETVAAYLPGSTTTNTATPEKKPSLPDSYGINPNPSPSTTTSPTTTTETSEAKKDTYASPSVPPPPSSSTEAPKEGHVSSPPTTAAADIYAPVGATAGKPSVPPPPGGSAEVPKEGHQSSSSTPIDTSGQGSGGKIAVEDLVAKKRDEDAAIASGQQPNKPPNPTPHRTSDYDAKKEEHTTPGPASAQDFMGTKTSEGAPQVPPKNSYGGFVDSDTAAKHEDSKPKHTPAPITPSKHDDKHDSSKHDDKYDSSKHSSDNAHHNQPPASPTTGKVSLKDKISGGAKVIAGKLGGKEEKVAEGKRILEHGKEGSHGSGY